MQEWFNIENEAAENISIAFEAQKYLILEEKRSISIEAKNVVIIYHRSCDSKEEIHF